MKRIIIIAALVLASLSASAQKWIDASTLDVYGKAMPTEETFIRVDVDKYPLANASMNKQGKQCAGLFLHFKTTSSFIYARWTTSPRNAGDNHDAIGQKGLDLYILRDGKWLFAGVGRPSMKKEPFDHHEHKIVETLPKGDNEFLLYLPLYDSCTSLYIGIEENASLESLPNPFRHKVLMVGSSIVQGASSSRPGLLFSSQFTRATGIYMINLGFSGNSKMQECLADYLVNVKDVDAIVVDGMSNPNVKEIRSRFDTFISRLREANPGVPIIVLPPAFRELRLVNTRYNEHFNEQDQAAAEVVAAYIKNHKDDKDFYYLPKVRFNNTADGFQTTDGVHSNDLSYYFFLKDFTPAVTKILKKYRLK
ncbi:MAG: SGNH/GDSL hydrolase family protein [Bacteroidales bacterium]|nr:SGNH/GDSL hydrolase family protein [Bacteroidales bacterium]